MLDVGGKISGEGKRNETNNPESTNQPKPDKKHSHPTSPPTNNNGKATS
jgi:hypothetical protein